MYKKKAAKSDVVSLTQIEEKDADALSTRAIDRELFTILINIQEKLNSPVFNGGFERLAASVEDIKDSQKKTEERIVDLDKRIYEPDEGLFSRIKLVEKQHEQSVQAVKTQHEHDVHALTAKIKVLEDFKASVHKALWYVIPATVAGLFKIFWDLASDHVVIK